MSTRRREIVGRVLEYCKRERIFAPDQRVLLAVSGGADSMVMLEILAGLRRPLGIEIVVAHVNHGLRDDADLDQILVVDTATKMNVTVVTAQIDVMTAVSKDSLSIEEAARTLRYAELQRISAEIGAEVTATGHTATDQAETLLLRMIRGTGPLGMSGILARRTDGVVRPLLCLTREDVRDHAKTAGLTYRDDPTNADETFQRNRIRLTLLPLLREMNPRIDFVLSGLAEDSAALANGIRTMVGAGISRSDEDGVTVVEHIDIPRDLLAYRALAAFETASGSPLGLSRPHVQTLIDMMTATGKKESHLPRRVVAKSSHGRLELKVEKDGPPPGSARRKPRT